MSNYLLTAGPFIAGQPYNECYIADIMDLSETHFMIFTRVYLSGEKRQFRLYAIPQSEAAHLKPYLTPLPEDTETISCFWSPFTQELDRFKPAYIWEDTREEINTLIWWDHDLGDVVLDSIKDCENTQVPTTLEDYEYVTDNVYFYWIT